LFLLSRCAAAAAAAAGEENTRPNARRYREEVLAGRPRPLALQKTLSTAGHTVGSAAPR
jgi:hypothetical protein